MTRDQLTHIEEAKKQTTAGLMGLDVMGIDFQAVNSARLCFQRAESEMASALSLQHVKAQPKPIKGGVDSVRND